MKKKWKKVLYLTLCLWATALFAGTENPAMASDPVTAALPAFPVAINGISIEQAHNPYPPLVYRDITYIAMTYQNARLLGLSSSWTQEAGLSIEKASAAAEQPTLPDNLNDKESGMQNQANYAVSDPAFPITVNGKAIDNGNEPYPLFVFRDVTYFPLTWRFAVEEFGWSYTFDSVSGLAITPAAAVPELDDSFSEHMPGAVSSTVQVTGDVVNLRRGAGTDQAIVGQARKGESLTVLDSGKDKGGKLWYAVETGGGLKGWIASWYTSAASAAEQESTPAESAGVRTKLELVRAEQTGRKTVFSLKNGAGSTYSIEKVDANTLQLLLRQVDLDQPIRSARDGFDLSAAAANSGEVRLTVKYRPGDYVSIEQEADRLILNCYHTGRTLSGRTIVLDPGHGGVDVGGVGYTMKHVTDADIGYTVALKLKAMLENAGATVILTRGDLSKTERVRVAERMEINNQAEPDLFVSIHGNSSEGVTKATGAETYTYNGKIYSQQYLSENLAQKICEGLGESTGRKSVVKKANFYMLRLNHHPAVLVETGYLNNPEDEKLLATDAYRQKLAEGIYQGILQYLGQF